MASYHSSRVGWGGYRKRRSGPPRSSVSAVCPFSPSCFLCPLADCIADPRKNYNEILDGDLYLELLGPSDQDDPDMTLGT